MNFSAYIIGAFNQAKYAQTYFDSLDILGDVEVIVVQYLRRGKFEPVKVPKNVKLIKYKKEYPGNTGKHKDFREIVGPLLTDDKWCIFTDMHDVVFQTPLPELPSGTSVILAASESVTFGEVDYWSDIFPASVRNWEVYNVGCFAMKRDVLRMFWDNLYENWMEFYSWYKSGSIPRIGNGDTFPFNIPFHEKVKVEMAIMFNGHYDTLCFNEFIRSYGYSELPGLFACYAFQVDKGVIVNNDGQLFRDGKLTTIAHFNGNTKKWMKGGK